MKTIEQTARTPAAPSSLSSRSFFDARAAQWDAMVYHDPEKLDALFRLLRLQPGETVLDVGTGTGILIPRILRAVGPEGRCIALDLSSEMLKEARRRVQRHGGEDRTQLLCADFLQAEANLETATLDADVIIAYSCFPHFSDPAQFFRRSREILAPRSGRLMIPHGESGEPSNGPPSSLEAAGDAPQIPRPLPPAEKLVQGAKRMGFNLLEKRDDDSCFFLYLHVQ